MSSYLHQNRQFLPIGVRHAWTFFSSPKNLSLITPPEMNFSMRANLDDGDTIYEGMKIDYTVSPILHIPLHWQSLIEQVVPYTSFTDTQLKGPFKIWEHTHIFEEIEGGTIMTDLVKYELIGRLVHTLVVLRKIKQVFLFREKILTQSVEKYANNAY